MPQEPQFLDNLSVEVNIGSKVVHAADHVVKDAVKAKSWVRSNIVKLHLTALGTAWGVFEFLAPRLAAQVHQAILHIFWGSVMHRVFHFISWLR